jgi:hypothetical protein
VTDPYDRLLELTEREHALVVAGAWEELAGVDMTRRALLADLPPRPPATARPALEAAVELQTATAVLLSTQVRELRRSLGHVARGRVAVQGYGDGAGAARVAARVDLAG